MSNQYSKQWLKPPPEFAGIRKLLSGFPIQKKSGHEGLLPCRNRARLFVAFVFYLLNPERQGDHSIKTILVCALTGISQGAGSKCGSQFLGGM